MRARDRIRAALLEHLVLFFPEQRFDARGLAALGRHFGELGFYPLIEGLPEEPHVIALIKEAHDWKNFGEDWHADTSRDGIGNEHRQRGEVGPSFRLRPEGVWNEGGTFH